MENDRGFIQITCHKAQALQQFSKTLSLCYLDGAVPWGGHNVFVVKIDHVDGSSVSHKDTTKADVSRRGHVPDGNRTVFRAGDHQAVGEAQVKNCLVVVDECVQYLTRRDLPHPAEDEGRE